MPLVDRRNLTTAQRAAECVDAMQSRGHVVQSVEIEGRKFRLNFLDTMPQTPMPGSAGTNPADLIEA